MRNITPKKIEEEMPMTSKEGPRLIYPHFSIAMEHLPEAEKWDLKDKYTITIELVMTGKSIEERGNRKSGYADFDITGIEVIDNKKKNYKVLKF